MRIVFALALVLLTFNPSGWSFYHWLVKPDAASMAVKAFAGIGLLIGWIVCVRTAATALGLLGSVLLTALMAAAVWMLIDFNVITTPGRTTLTWIGLVIAGAVLGLGLSWSLIRARVTGQIEAD